MPATITAMPIMSSHITQFLCGKILVRTVMDVPYLVSALVIGLVVFMRHCAVTLTKQTDAALQSELEYRKRVMGF
jgi:ABC-type sulfate transport system permease subunit